MSAEKGASQAADSVVPSLDQRPHERASEMHGAHDHSSHGLSRDQVAEAGTRGVSSLYTDKVLPCADCGQEFAFTASEQEFYAQRQFSDPRRCPSCRASRKAARGDSGGGSSYGASSSSYGSRPSGGSSYGGSSYGASRGPREMFTATCSSCGREAQVPFRPTNGKPVYCNDCFATRRA